MDKKEWKGTVYKSQDYSTPRTSREAFGMQVRSEDFVTFSHGVRDKTRWEDVAVFFGCLLVAVYIMFFGLGD
jgi:hypothetical protein